MGIQFEIIAIGTYADGYFKGIGPDGQETTCYLHNKERDWDKLCDYLDKPIVVRGSLMTPGNFLVMEIIDANDIDTATKEEKAKARDVKRAMYKNWAFSRWLGLRDIPTMFKIAASKRTRKKELKKLESPKHLGEIHVGHDHEVDYWVEPMSAGTQSCPYWDTTRLFYGREMNFSIDEKPMEYFLGIRQTFLAPIIPIPICSYEEVYILGTTDEAFRACKRKYGRARSFHDHAEEFGAVKIFDEMFTWFIESDKKYRDDPVWSTCG